MCVTAMTICFFPLNRHITLSGNIDRILVLEFENCLLFTLLYTLGSHARQCVMPRKHAHIISTEQCYETKLPLYLILRNVSLCLITRQAVNICGVKALLHVILISEWDSFHNKAALSRERSHHYQLIGGWVSTTTDLNVLENKLISSSYLLSNLSVRWPGSGAQ